MPKQSEYNITRVATMSLNKQLTQTTEMAKVLKEMYPPIEEICELVLSKNDEKSAKKLNSLVFGSKKKKKNKETGELVEVENLNFDRGHCNNVSAAIYTPQKTENKDKGVVEFLKDNPLIDSGILPLKFEDGGCYVFDDRMTNRYKDAVMASALYRLGSHHTCNERTRGNYDGKVREFIELGKSFEKYPQADLSSLIEFYNFVEEHQGRIDFKFINYVKYCVNTTGTINANGGRCVVLGKDGKEHSHYFSMSPEIYQELLKRNSLWKPDGILFDENLDEYLHLFMYLHSKEEGGRGIWKKESQFTSANPLTSPCEAFLNSNFIRIKEGSIVIDNENYLLTMEVLLPPKKTDTEPSRKYTKLVFNFGSPTVKRTNGKIHVNKKKKNRQMNDLEIKTIPGGKYGISFKTPCSGGCFEKSAEETVVEPNGETYKQKFKIVDGELSEFRLKLIIHNKNMNWADPGSNDYDVVLTVPYRVKGNDIKFNENIKKTSYPSFIQTKNQKRKGDEKRILKLDAGTRFITMDWGLNPIATFRLCEATGEFGKFNSLKVWNMTTLPEHVEEERKYYDLLNLMGRLRRLVGQTKAYIQAKKNNETQENIDKLELFGNEYFDELNKYSSVKLTRDGYVSWLNGMIASTKTLPQWLGRDSGWYVNFIFANIHKMFSQLTNNRKTLKNDMCLLKLWDSVMEDKIRTSNCVFRFGQPPISIGKFEENGSYKELTERRQNLMKHFHKFTAHQIHSWCHEYGVSIVVMEQLGSKFSRKNSKRENSIRKKLGLNTFKTCFIGSVNTKYFINYKEGIMLVEVDENLTSQTNPENGELGYRNFENDKSRLYIGEGKWVNADEAATYNLAKRFITQHTDLSSMWLCKVGEYYVAKGSLTPEKEDVRIKGMLSYHYGRYNILFENCGTETDVQLVPSTVNKFEEVKLSLTDAEGKISTPKLELFYKIQGKWCNRSVYEKHIETMQTITNVNIVDVIQPASAPVPEPLTTGARTLEVVEK